MNSYCVDIQRKWKPT